MSSLGLLSQDAVAEQIGDLNNDIPYVSKIKIKNPSQYTDGLPDSPVPTEEEVDTISRARWEQIEATHDASERVQKVLNREFDGGIRATVKSNSPMDHSVLVQKVVNADTEKESLNSSSAASRKGLDAIRRVVPSSTPGVAGKGTDHRAEISVDVEVEEVAMKNIAKFNDRYRPVPGGSKMEMYVENSVIKHKEGTNAAPLYSNDASGRVMLTCGHLFEASDNNNHYYKGHQPQKEELADSYVGERYDHIYDYETDAYGNRTSVNKDVGVWEPGPDTGTIYSLACEGSNCPKIFEGIITWDTIKNKAGTDYTVRQQGSSTGVTTGTIESTDPTYKTFTTTANGEKGDSGGPMFRYSSSDYVEVLGVTSQASLDGSQTKAHSIDWAMDQLNLSL